MTEQEWLTCNDPQPMLEYLRGRTSERKLRLFACAYCRAAWVELSGRSRKAVRAAEHYLEGKIKLVALRNATPRVTDHDTRGATYLDGHTDGTHIDCVSIGARYCLTFARHPGEDGLVHRHAERERLQSVQVIYLRDIFGSPFRPLPINHAWLSHTVTSLARAAHLERIMPSGELDPARLAVLSDALEEGGCDNASIIDHLRSPGPHVRGCWTLDLILGKE